MTIKDALSEFIGAKCSYEAIQDMGLNVKLLHDIFAYNYIPNKEVQRRIRARIWKDFPLIDIEEKFL
jgi:hypothetical protein